MATTEMTGPLAFLLVSEAIPSWRPVRRRRDTVRYSAPRHRRREGGWSFDQAWMGQRMAGPVDGGAILRRMTSFGITEKVPVLTIAGIKSLRD